MHEYYVLRGWATCYPLLAPVLCLNVFCFHTDSLSPYFAHNSYKAVTIFVFSKLIPVHNLSKLTYLPNVLIVSYSSTFYILISSFKKIYIYNFFSSFFLASQIQSCIISFLPKNIV